MGIRHPLISEIAKDTYLFNEFGLCNHYLLVGTERALLIDLSLIHICRPGAGRAFRSGRCSSR